MKELIKKDIGLDCVDPVFEAENCGCCEFMKPFAFDHEKNQWLRVCLLTNNIINYESRNERPMWCGFNKTIQKSTNPS